MYARITTYQADAAKLDEMETRLEEIKGKVKSMAGAVAVYTAWRADGQGVTVAIYESQEAADAASERVQAIWGSMAEFLTAAPSVETYDRVARLTG